MTARMLAALAPMMVLACARGGQPKLPAPLSAPAPAAERLKWVATDAARAVESGAGPALVVAAGGGAAGDSIGGRIDVPVEDCVLILARGSPSIEDLDVFVYADDGAVLGADDKPSPGGSVLVCPPHPRHVYAFGRLAAGHGMLTVSAQLVRLSDAERAARAVGAKGRLELRPLGDQGWPGLDDALLGHRKALGAPFRDVRRLAVPLDARIATRVSIAADADECLDVFVLPSDDVALVDLTLLDGEGRIVGRSANEDATPSILVCAPAHSALTVELRPHAGRGLAAVIVGVNDEPNARKEISGELPVLEIAPTESVDAGRAKLGAKLTRSGYPTGRTVGKGTAKVGERVVLPVDVPAGCSRLDVLGGTPTRLLDAWLWSGAGELIAHDDGNSVVTLFACGPAPGARLDVEAIAHGGPFVVEMRTQHGDFESLSEKPLAASRLLGRLSAGERIRTPKDALSAKRVALDATDLATARAQVAPGTCLEVALALGSGAQGAELRIVDVDGDAEVARARGTYSAMAEVCALDRPKALELRIELRVIAGATDALLSMSPRTPRMPPVKAPSVTAPGR